MKHSHVVVAYDFSPQSEAVLARAVALVQRAPSHILHFITVIDAHAGVPAVPHEGKIDHNYADRVHDLVADAIRKAFGTTPISDEIHFFVHARIGKPTQEILALAEELGADLILIGTHGRTGLSRAVMGSTAEHVVREAGCPVLVARSKRYPDIELPTVTKVENHHMPQSRARGFSYKNNIVIVRPPDWNLM